MTYLFLKKIRGRFLVFLLILACNQKIAIQPKVMNFGDFELECSQIEEGIDKANQDIMLLKHHKKLKTAKNTASIFLSPFTLFTSLFFLDFSDQEEDQIQFYKMRIKHLEEIKQLKQC